MNTTVAIVGPSGSGKSTSISHLEPAETFIVQCMAKALPFRGWRKNYSSLKFDKKKEKSTGNLFTSADPIRIAALMDHINDHRPDIKTIVIDDYQATMVKEYFARGNDGFQKFTDIGTKADIILTKAADLRDDLTVIFITHDEVEDGARKAKTVGKLLDKNMTWEGYFTVVLFSDSEVDEEGKLTKSFVTQSDGTTRAKSPIGMFENFKIPNDLRFVVDKIQEYDNGE